MQLQQLSYFVTLADTGHFTRAADRVGIAQPTMSQQIRALEANLGTALFVRRPRGVELTAAGEELLPIARRIVAEVDNAHRSLAELADLKRGRVRFGATPSLCTGLLPTVLAEFQREHPGLQILLTEGGSRDLQLQLSDGQLDLALVVDSRAPAAEGLTTVPLFVEDLVVISSRTAPRPTRRRQLPLAELRNHRLVMFRDGYDLRETTIAACRGHGFEPTFAVAGGEMDAVLSLVAAGVGVALVPRTVVDDRFRVTTLAAPGLTRTVELSRRDGIELSRSALDLQRRLLTVASRPARDVEPTG